ncbi:MAG: hypothetical protein AAGH15_07615 [Myxococcota bacterium]
MVRALTAAALLLVVAAPAEAQRRGSRSAGGTFDVYAAFGAAGSIDGPGIEADLDTTIGFGVRFIATRGNAVALIGPMFELLAWQAEGADDRSLIFDPGLFLGVGRRFQRRSLGWELYGAFPLTFAYANDFPGRSDAGLGFSLGALLGNKLWIGKRLAVLFEVGWRHHMLFESGDRASFNQVGIHAGLALDL